MLSFVGILFLGLHALAQNSSISDWPTPNRLTLDQRLGVIQQVCRAMRSRYIGWSQTRPGYPGGEVLCKGAEKTEQDISDSKIPNDWVSHMQWNYQFEDRLIQLLASFRDGHLNALFDFPRATISLQVLIEEVEGQFHISAVSPVLRPMIADAKKLLKGHQVLRINGKPIEQAIQEQLPYISASTDQARRQAAIEAFTLRRWAFPGEAQATLSLKNQEGVEYTVQLTWFFRTENRIAESYLKSFGLLSIEDATSEARNGKNRKVLSYQFEADRFNTSFEARFGPGKIKTIKNSEEEFFKVGEDQHYVWIRLLSFNEGGAEVEQNEKIIQSRVDDWTELLNQTVLEAKQNKKKVILDLRNNPGGSRYSALEILSRWVKAREFFVYYVQTFRKNHPARWANLSWVDKSSRCAKDPECLAKQKKALDLFYQSIRQSAEGVGITEAYPVYDVGQRDFDWDFSSQMLVLVGPNCVSQCENFSRFLSQYMGVKTLGKPTHGTGYGFTGSAYFKDDLSVIRFEIPNYAFSPVSPENASRGSIIEGCGFQPSLSYSSSLCDLTDDEIDLWAEIYRRFPPNP